MNKLKAFLIIFVLTITLSLISNRYQVYKVSQDSMNNTFFDNDRLIVEKSSNQIKINIPVILNYNGETFVKRCVALPGNTIEIKQGRFFTNGMTNDTIKTIRISNIRSNSNIIIEGDDEYRSIEIFHCYGYNWSALNFGPYIIPKKGLKLCLTDKNSFIYKNLIDNENEPGFYSNIKKSKQLEYVFKKNYYFVLGDNRLSSIDSRFFGPVPEENIFGIVKFAVSAH